MLRTQLEAEGVGITTTKTGSANTPSSSHRYKNEPSSTLQFRLTKPRLVHDIRRLSDLNVSLLGAILGKEDVTSLHTVRLTLEFATTKTEVHQAEIGAAELSTSRELIGSITNKIIMRAKLPNRFAELYPSVREYIVRRCFDREVDIDADTIRSHLSRLEIQETIAHFLSRKIAELTLDRRAIEFDRADFRLSDTKPFSWRRNLPPPLVAERTVFNSRRDFTTTSGAPLRCFSG